MNFLLSLVCFITISYAIFSEEISSIHLRKFVDHDSELHCIKVIVDDGSGQDVIDMEGVTKRYLLYFTFCESGPACGKPSAIEERILDLSSGKEIPVRTIVNTYSTQGCLVQQDVIETQESCYQITCDASGKPTKVIDRQGISISIDAFSAPKEDNDRLQLDDKMSFESESYFKNIANWGINGIKSLVAGIYDSAAFIQKKVVGFHQAEEEYARMSHVLLGKPLLFLMGHNHDQTGRGILGKGEVNDKVRITHINGILNSKTDTLISADMISESHGGVNVHYTYRASQGWTLDFFKCCLVKFGYTSVEAYELAESWREMLREMDATETDGIIIHYAHSIGGSETNAAKQLLSPEEQKRIRVATFGSPTLIANEGFNGVVNYVGKRDVISFFDPINYTAAMISPTGHVVFVGKYQGIFPEHFFGGESYRTVVEMLGRQFVETYGTVNTPPKS